MSLLPFLQDENFNYKFNFTAVKFRDFFSMELSIQNDDFSFGKIPRMNFPENKKDKALYIVNHFRYNYNSILVFTH